MIYYTPHTHTPQVKFCKNCKVKKRETVKICKKM